ncbi:MAG: hypothetical protein ABIP17_15905 [Ilumatobacteraceae bacterium]
MAVASILPVRDRCLPVDEAFTSMLPDAGLVRGRVVGCTGPAAISLALSLGSRAATTGAWLAVVGVPMLGVEAACELGVPLERLVMVDTDARPATWAERIGAAADGFDLILTQPPPGADRVVRKVRQRLQARGVVLLAVGPTTPGISCDIEFSTTAVEWAGVGLGHGSLMGRRAMVRVGGRRMPRSVERELWLPGPHGRVEDATRSSEQFGASTHEITPVAALSRAG